MSASCRVIQLMALTQDSHILAAVPLTRGRLKDAVIPSRLNRAWTVAPLSGLPLSPCSTTPCWVYWHSVSWGTAVSRELWPAPDGAGGHGSAARGRTSIQRPDRPPDRPVAGRSGPAADQRNLAAERSPERPGAPVRSKRGKVGRTAVGRPGARSRSKRGEGAGRTAAGRPAARTAPPWVQR